MHLLPFFIAFMATYGFSLVVDFFRSAFEVVINFIYKNINITPTRLSSQEAVIIIPCHNSAGVISGTLTSLPADYHVLCVINASTDGTETEIKQFQIDNPHRYIKVLNISELGKINAVYEGVKDAIQNSFSHFLLLDDDVVYSGQDILAFDKSVAMTAYPVIPSFKNSFFGISQIVEYALMCLSKRAQSLFGNTIMASGAAGLYRIDAFVDCVQHHDGDHIGDDLQTSFIYHALGHKIDFMDKVIVETHAPDSIAAWWKQRAKRWELSPFKNLDWSLKVLFSNKNPGWWIRGIVFYRHFVILTDIVRIVTFPLACYYNPQTVAAVFAITYAAMILKGLAFYAYMNHYNKKDISVKSYLYCFLYPAYGFLSWLSRLAAMPAGFAKAFNRHVLGNSPKPFRRNP